MKAAPLLAHAPGRAPRSVTVCGVRCDLAPDNPWGIDSPPFAYRGSLTAGRWRGTVEIVEHDLGWRGAASLLRSQGTYAKVNVVTDDYAHPRAAAEALSRVLYGLCLWRVPLGDGRRA